MAPPSPDGHHVAVDDELDIATVPGTGDEPPRAHHGPRPLDADVVEAHWRELPPPPPAPPRRIVPPPPVRPGRLRRRLGWWTLALLLAGLGGAATLWLQSEPPPCGERLFIPSTEGGTGCVDPALLKHNAR